MDKADRLIKKALFELLREQAEDKLEKEEKPEDKPEKPQKKPASKKNVGVISTAGALGSGGRAKSFVASAKARANEDPKGLLSDLGVRGPAGGNDLQAAQEILTTAIYGNPVMGDAYRRASITKDTIPRLEGAPEKVVVAIEQGSLDRKNGIRFLAHTLIAAQNAGFLDLQGGLQFGRGDTNSIVIYSI